MADRKTSHPPRAGPKPPAGSGRPHLTGHAAIAIVNAQSIALGRLLHAVNDAPRGSPTRQELEKLVVTQCAALRAAHEVVAKLLDLPGAPPPASEDRRGPSRRTVRRREARARARSTRTPSSSMPETYVTAGEARSRETSQTCRQDEQPQVPDISSREPVMTPSNACAQEVNAAVNAAPSPSKRRRTGARDPTDAAAREAPTSGLKRGFLTPQITTGLAPGTCGRTQFQHEAPGAPLLGSSVMDTPNHMDPLLGDPQNPSPIL